jgi:hypothetical protein
MSKLRLNGTTSGYTELSAADTAGNNTFVLPSADGSSGQVLSTDGSGNLSWATAASSSITQGNSSAAVIDTGSDGRFVVTTEGAEALRIDSSGNLGLNETSPSTFNDASTGGVNFVIGATGTGRGVLTFASEQTGGTDELLGVINFVDSDTTNAAKRGARIIGVRGSDANTAYLRFDTANSGAPVERMRITSTGLLYCPGVYNSTTGVGANVVVQSDGKIERSTSSAKYKTNVETLEDKYADALLGCRPVWYRSLCASDNPNHGFWGFIAEEVAAIDPRLVHWKTVEVSYDEKGSAVETPCNPEPEGVAYERFVPHLLNLIKRQHERIETLEAANTDLAARITALEAS